MNFYQQQLQAQQAILAPMAGFTDAPFRKLCRHYGSAWAVTEMVSARALVRGQQQGIEIGAPYPGEPGLVIQIFGGEPAEVAEAGALLHARYQPQALDINMGCPVKKITGKSCGAKLMLEPDRAAAITAALVAAVPVPVSVKTRLGYDTINGHEVAQALQEAGAALLAIHGRTARQKYSGSADWHTIAEIASKVHIPVVGSGDVDSLAQYQRYRSWGLGVMVARAAVGRPWLFSELQGNPPPSQAERHAVILAHARSHVAWYSKHGRASDTPKEAEVRAMRSFRGQLLKYLPQARQQVITVTRLHELESLLLPHPLVKV